MSETLCEMTIDDKGRVQLPVRFRKQFALAPGDELKIIREGKRLELRFPAKAEASLAYHSITVGGAEELAGQGIAVEADGDKKIVRLRR